MTSPPPSTIPELSVRVTKLDGKITQLAQVVGHAPDASLGRPGAGLCGVVAELAIEARQRRRWVASAGAIGAGIGAALVQAVQMMLGHG